ncbi:MAG: hypothetical protein ABII75_05795 [Candidatus Omnitrophota bacterium]
METKIPIGVKIISAANVFLGANIFLLGMFNLVKARFVPALIFLFISFAIIKLGFSTYQLKPRSRTDNRAIAILGILAAFILLSSSRFFKDNPVLAPYLFYLAIFYMVYFTGAVVYLSIPKVKRYWQQ